MVAVSDPLGGLFVDSGRCRLERNRMCSVEQRSGPSILLLASKSSTILVLQNMQSPDDIAYLTLHASSILVLRCKTHQLLQVSIV